MAAGPARQAGVIVDGASGGSVKLGRWQTAHLDLTATAASAGVLKRPLSNTSSNVVAVKVPAGATRVKIRVRHTDTSAVTTSPIVSLYGVYCDAGKPNSAGWFDDNASSNEVIVLASAVTLTCATTDVVVLSSDTVSIVQYSACPVNAIDSNPWFDCQGSQYIVVLVSTAAVLVSATEAFAQVAFLN